MSEAPHLDVKIMGREYRVACTPQERPALLAAVDRVDSKMREIAQRGKNTLSERVAVMAALNIAHESLSASPSSQTFDDPLLASSDIRGRIESMGARLDAVLAPQSGL